MKFIRLPQVLDKVGLRKTALYERVQSRDFPAPTKLGHVSVWLEEDVDAWMLRQMGMPAAAPAQAAIPNNIGA